MHVYPRASSTKQAAARASEGVNEALHARVSYRRTILRMRKRNGQYRCPNGSSGTDPARIRFGPVRIGSDQA
jgi:hypothetical protein